MDHAEVGRYWDQNADTWTELVRAGYDIYRDLVNTPAFLAMVHDLTGRNGLDLGCREGHNTRLLARRGAQMTAIDITGRFLDAAVTEERHRPLGIRYLHSSAVAPAVSGRRVRLRGRLHEPDGHARPRHRPGRGPSRAPVGRVSAVLHRAPPTAPPASGWVTDQHGRRVARTIGGYFVQQQVDTWSLAPRPKRPGATGDRFGSRGSRARWVPGCTRSRRPG
jgi:SAM-dependent methyltransferase